MIEKFKSRYFVGWMLVAVPVFVVFAVVLEALSVSAPLALAVGFLLNDVLLDPIREEFLEADREVPR